MLQKYFTSKRQSDRLVLPQFQSHRGWCRDGATENSLKAIGEAVRLGSEMVEVDVHLSSDKEVLLSHDPSLKRLFASDVLIGSSAWAELRAFEGLCLLSEALSSFPKTRFNIELKESPYAPRTCAGALGQVIKKAKAESRCLISSFQPHLLRACSTQLPDVPRGFLVSSKYPWVIRALVPLSIYTRAHLLHLEEVLIFEHTARVWRDRGLGVVAWTVNDRERAQELLSWGVRSVISDEIIS